MNRLKVDLEVVGRDPQPLVQVEAVRILAVRPHPGVEVQLAAAQAASFGKEPVEQRTGVSLAAEAG